MHKSTISSAALSPISATLSLGSDVGAASHSNLFLCYWTQRRTAHTVVRKSKWQASTYKGRNALIWEYLDETKELNVVCLCAVFYISTHTISPLLTKCDNNNAFHKHIF